MHTVGKSKIKLHIQFMHDFFFQWLESPLGPRPPHFSRLHDHTLLDAPHSVGLLWTRDQLVAETST
jgi:hypothetical protein